MSAIFCPHCDLDDLLRCLKRCMFGRGKSLVRYKKMHSAPFHLLFADFVISSSGSSYWKCCYAVHHLGRHSHIFCAIPIGEKANAPRRVNCARPATSTCYANAVTYVEEEMTPGRSWPLVAPDPYAAVPDRPSGVAGRPLACRTVHFLWIALYTSTTM